MADRALSLLRTVLHPVLANFPFGARRRAAGLPTPPHHGVPTVNLQGIVLSRETTADTALADDMYAGHYAFAGEVVTALPDTLFRCQPPSGAWQDELLSFGWLAAFRASGRSLHALFALRLIAAWSAARPAYQQLETMAEGLSNLSVDGPALALRLNPTAVAVVRTAILQLQALLQDRTPATTPAKVNCCMALLAAHLASRASDKTREKLANEVLQHVDESCAGDGSHGSGEIAALLELYRKLDILQRGLEQAGEVAAGHFAARLSRIKSYLALLTREDGTLVFGLGDSLPNPAKPVRETGLAPIAGHARLQSRQTVIFAAAAEMNAASPLQLEAYHAGAPFFALGVQPPAGIWRRQQLEVMTSSAGHLLEIDHVTRTGSRRRVSVFLSDDGTDLRYEERAEMSGCASLELTLPLGASVSTTQGGLGALITFGKLASWQLLVRGGHVQAHGSILTITPDARETACLNFALRAAAKKSRKANPKANDGSGARQLL